VHWSITEPVVNGALGVAQEIFDCSPLSLPCTVVEACRHPSSMGNAMPCAICQPGELANCTEIGFVLHELNLLSAEASTSIDPAGTMGFLIRVQSPIPSSR
jgi:hypothetical protein